ncbi:MAG: metalloregulator ArsR/SmtB family transcription factor [Gammaproteobacteria bacterium]|nr:metalloregulator ArsR/SmtB family transcription factor [Gammaproteobacteria bacterium]
MAVRIDIDAIEAQANKASSVLGALSNEKRLVILCQLVDGERSVNDLTELLGAPQSTISQHLGVLRREGLVQTRRDAQTLYYSLAGNEARAILETLQALYCPPPIVDA